jgi:putative nucleotidyltransferase with HDIG domain
MTPLRILGDNIFKHSICVAAYSVAVGKEMYFPRHRLELLGTAALLHDIGMCGISRLIVNKKGELTEKEIEIIQQHPRIGFEMVQNAGGFSAEIYNIILEHHERFDGTGYPKGLKNKKIHTMAKIIGICDVYNALTSDRPYRSRYKRTESIEFILGSGNYYSNYEIVKALIENIVVYKFGQWVELSTGETGVVIEDEVQGFSFKPKIMICFDKNGKHKKEKNIMDLSLRENANISIKRII